MEPEETIGFDWRMRPRRAANVELSEVTDGYLVYQPERDRVHYLNPTAALILQICDGGLTAEDLPDFLASSFSLAEPPRDEVAACLRKLLGEGLLEVDGRPI
jgi:coenzyme PQQ synthesis protein D (PqqD)